MSTIAIIGAGPGLGQSIAKQFGSHGFDIALIARNQQKLDQLTADLTDPATIAAAYWDRYQQRTDAELFYRDETLTA
jgi:short-subunit dehydrogenase